MKHLIEKRPNVLREKLSDIVSISKAEKNALGFLPHAAYEDAIAAKRLIASLAESKDGKRYVTGYLLFGGVYPHARIFQVGVLPEKRREGVASALLDALISQLEQASYISVTAHVASDLTQARAFYAKNGFEIVRERAGGDTRARSILVHHRGIETENLFSIASRHETAPALLSPRSSDVPFYTFDLNVFFDLVKNRARHESACKLFGAALQHRLRLGIAPEFISELKRSEVADKYDPVLQMAINLPRLPRPSNTIQLDNLATEIHHLVFVEPGASGASSKQAHSDAKHLALSSRAGATAFITSDRAILAARNELLTLYGIDVISLEEFIELLTDWPEESAIERHKTGMGFSFVSPTPSQVETLINEPSTFKSLSHLFVDQTGWGRSVWRVGITEGARLVAFACLKPPAHFEDQSELTVYVEPGHLDREIYTEYLLHEAVRISCSNSPVIIRLKHIPGQSAVLSFAKQKGFMPATDSKDLLKIVVGQPLTVANWSHMRDVLRRKINITLPQSFESEADLALTNASGASFHYSGDDLERLFAPAICLWPGREGVIVPIRKEFSEELLGSTAQHRFQFIENFDASFLSQRSYVNTARARNVMLPGKPIFFYESAPRGGRKAVVAVAKIVNTVLMDKNHTPEHDKARRFVVTDFSRFSNTGDVLLTTFENLIPFPNPVPYTELEKIDATGSTNLVSATVLPYEVTEKILTAGWTDGRTA
ncbi:GNAT family N-acetyltransferase [uncultured Martelella sp.]|uniref:GNAT family N-acetyltransferase n=1 Tax=uncultured Martelella sp. TaxID=392331 RepID=UPI0029C8DFFB|nr:GNAT family N-acetyltransferase [uncultured Martelella sp.]